MSAETDFEKAVWKIVSKKLPVSCIEGTVIDVDKTTKTCNVDREGKAQLHGVRLNAVLQAGEEVLTVYPKKNSKVICGIIDNQQTEAFVIHATHIEEISGSIGGQKFTWNKDGFLFNEGKLGGLPILAKIEDNLKSLKEFVETMHKSLPSAFSAIGAGSASAGTNGANAYNTAMTGKSIDIVNMENAKIKQ